MNESCRYTASMSDARGNVSFDCKANKQAVTLGVFN